MRQSQQRSSAFLSAEMFKKSMANNVDPDQSAHVLGPRCLLLYLISQ